MNHHLLLIIHLMSATVWVGGHLILVASYLPRAIKEKNQNYILNYEKKHEPIGMLSLILLVLSGILMAYKYGVTIEHWFEFATPIEKIVSTKLLLLFATLLFALSAQFKVLPKLNNNIKYLPEMALHILCVTIIGISMLILGSFVRFGGY